MKRLMIAISLVSAVFCLACGQANQQTQATADSASAEQELMQMERNIINAVLKRDVASYEQLLADDFTGTGNDGSLTTKAEEVSSMKSGATAVTSIEVHDMKAHVWGDAGVVWSRSTEKTQLEGNETSGQYQHITVWIRRSGRWQAVAAQSTGVVEK